MDRTTYQELTGITVSAGDAGRITAQIRRTKTMLETMLGFTLDPTKTDTNLYNELGKTSLECSCSNVNTEDLLPPDEVEGAYRLFSYNDLDPYFHVDPFTTVYKVKLVNVQPGSGDTGVTLKTFDADELRIQVGREGFSKYIEHCMTCLCDCSCTDCVQLAVDADWTWDDAENIPEDLLYVWADMVTFYADQRNNIKSESIDTHSYTKFERVAPETLPNNIAVIMRYAGPNGSVSVMPTTGAQRRR